jgi:hypothetical protein
MNTFGEGNKPPVQVMEDGSTRNLAGGPTQENPEAPDPRTDSFVGTNVFVLFDTSNYMHRGFVYDVFGGWDWRSWFSAHFPFSAGSVFAHRAAARVGDSRCERGSVLCHPF